MNIPSSHGVKLALLEAQLLAGSIDRPAFLDRASQLDMAGPKRSRLLTNSWRSPPIRLPSGRDSGPATITSLSGRALQVPSLNDGWPKTRRRRSFYSKPAAMI
jgi:hypothetical protein